MHRALCFQFHIRKAKHAGSANTMRFHLAPNLLRRIQLRAIGRQPVQSQPPFIAPNLRRQFPRLVHGMTVQNQENRLEAPLHQAIQKTANYLRLQFALFNHEPHVPEPIHGTQQIQAIPGSRRSHHRGSSFHPPGRSRMVIAAKTRFISKPNLRPTPLGCSGNLRILFFDPLPHSLRVLLIGPPKRLLGRNPQLRQQTTDRILAQANLVPTIYQNGNRLTSPQGKRKLVLPRIAAHDHSVNPAHHRTAQLALPTTALAGIQGIPATSTIHGQPIVNASSTKAHCANNILGTLTTLYPGNCTFAQFGEHFMFQFPTIHFFHGRYYITCITEMSRLFWTD